MSALWTPPSLYAGEAQLSRDGGSPLASFWSDGDPRTLDTSDIYRMRVTWTNPRLAPGVEGWERDDVSDLACRMREVRFVEAGEMHRGDWARAMVSLLHGTLDRSVAPCSRSRVAPCVMPLFWRWVDWRGADDGEWRRLRAMGLRRDVETHLRWTGDD